MSTKLVYFRLSIKSTNSNNHNDLKKKKKNPTSPGEKRLEVSKNADSKLAVQFPNAIMSSLCCLNINRLPLPKNIYSTENGHHSLSSSISCLTQPLPPFLQFTALPVCLYNYLQSRRGDSTFFKTTREWCPFSGLYLPTVPP